MQTPSASCLTLESLQRLTQQSADRNEIRRWASHIANCRQCSETTSSIGAERLVLKAVETVLGKQEPLLAALRVELEGRRDNRDAPRAATSKPIPGTWTLAAEGQGLADARFGTLDAIERPASDDFSDCTITDSESEGRLRRSPQLDRTLSSDALDQSPAPARRAVETMVASPPRLAVPTPFAGGSSTRPSATIPVTGSAIAVQTLTVTPLPKMATPHGQSTLGRVGNYDLLKKLGAGAVGIVYLAEDITLKRRVALKLLRPEDTQNALAKERFLREARAAAALDHENVVAVYQVGEENSIPYLAMQLLQGETLDDRIRREGVLPIPDVIRIGRDIAAGLEAAHERGLVHRDIKPANLWVEAGSQRVKILDFGLARGASDGSNLTRTGTVVGTPAFMSPEQGRGAPVDHRTDLYSLGCVLYQLCSGVTPITAEDMMSMLTALATEQPRPLQSLNPDVPAPLVGLINSLLAKHPEGRPSSATEVVELLNRLKQSEQELAVIAPKGQSRRMPMQDEETYEPTDEPSRKSNILLGVLFAISCGLMAVAFAPSSVTKPIKDFAGKFRAK